MTAPAQQPARVVLVRHGATDWSESGRHTGWIDLPMNQHGEQQVARLGEGLRGWRFDAVLSSPLQRARQTCAAAGYAEVAIIDPDLREWRYGNYEGLTSDEVRARRPGWNIWDGGVENGETLDELAERVDRVLRRVRSTDGDVAIFAHGHVLRVFAARWLGHAPRLAQNLLLSTASISTLGWEHEWPAIVLWNDVAHLRDG